MNDWLTNPEIWISFLTLVIMEIVLGIDNIIFISISTGRLPQHQQKKARLLGIGFALIIRVLLLLSITWVMTLTKPLFSIGDWIGLKDGKLYEQLVISGRDVILILGGFFLLYKATKEIHHSLEGETDDIETSKKSLSFTGTIIQIGLLDLVFGLDSVITAIGMSDHVQIMVAAVLVSMIFMVVAANPVGNFVNKHPSIKILALSFLLLIGVSLIAEGIEKPMSKSNIYFAMGFSIFVEFIILRMNAKRRKKEDPVKLKGLINS